MAWKIDNAHSEIGFVVKHLMISKVRGAFSDFGGTVDVNEQNPSQSRIEGWVNVASLSTGDEGRDQHLRSPDFFDVENHEKMAFTATNIERVAEDQYKVTGDLTIRDVTKSVTLDVSYEGKAADPWGGTRLGFNASAKINRKDFGLTWNVPLEAGGWLVGEDVKIDIELQIVKETETEAATA